MRRSLGVAEKLLDQAFWGLSQPGVDDQLPQSQIVDLGELDQHGRIAVEMRGSEVQLGLVGDQRELDALVGHPDPENVALRRFAPELGERFVVRLAQRTFPGDQLLADPPFVRRPLLDELQLSDDAGDVVLGGHDSLSSRDAGEGADHAAPLRPFSRLTSVAA